MTELDYLFDSLPKNEKIIALRLRALLLNVGPHVTEKKAFGAPFYYAIHRFAFIWPASIPWGNIKKGVALGFTKGHLMMNEEGLLQAEGRKNVYRIIFNRPEELDELQINQWIQEALLLDEQE
jgi:hypothetical protein